MGGKTSRSLGVRNEGMVYLPKGKIITYKEVQYMKFQLLQKKVEIHEQNSPNSFILAQAYNELGELFVSEGYIEASLEEFLKSLVILSQIEQDSLFSAKVMFNVSKVYIYQKLYNHAIKQLTKSLEIRLKECPRSIEVAEAYSGLEYASDKLGMTEKAAEYRRLALELENELHVDAMERISADKSNATALVHYYQECGQHLVEESLSRKDQRNGDTKDSVLLNNLLFDAALKYEAALVLVKLCEDIPSEHASVLCELGRVYALQQNHVDAVTNYHKALEMLEKLSSSATVSSTTNGEHTLVMVRIADLHKHIGDSVLCLKDYEIMSSGSGTASVASAASVFNIQTTVNPIKIARSASPIPSVDTAKAGASGTTESSSRSLVVALQHFKQSEQILDIFHPLSVTAAQLYSAISSIHHKQKQYTLAVEYLQKTLVILNKEQPRTVDVAEAHISLGQAYFDSGDSKEALLQYQMASELYEVLLPDSQQVASTYVNIGLVYKDQGYPSTALVEFQKALAICTAMDSSEDVKRVQELIGSLAKRPHVMVSYL